MAGNTAELPPHGKQKYPWPKWTDGRVHRAVRGKQFAIDPESFRAQLHTKARSIEKRVETRVAGDRVTFQFFEKEE